ncbi:hydrogenase maturation nickel metallochaperone HypA/HybF [Sphingobacterium corticibacter]|uniref:Hydrogenase expression protein n=1 Tax=Sphingobacterium corticibacter TaxID=2171749 RepID=A0A2T8HME7_9SPHI|nr:hydrogenase maturation nickel metallochaperone HypA [Sphingobacterium corticibacter]PVH26607.1 hydrogenase expression protein [Sphingobacterium corticibacter]
MHETGIVQEIFDTLQQEYPYRYQSIVKIQLEAGLLSNIQPILIQNAFEAYVIDEPQFAEVELEVKVLPIHAFCENCQEAFEVVFHRFVCNCGTPSSQVIQGEELRISQVIFKKEAI